MIQEELKSTKDKLQVSNHRVYSQLESLSMIQEELKTTKDTLQNLRQEQEKLLSQLSLERSAYETKTAKAKLAFEKNSLDLMKKHGTVVENVFQKFFVYKFGSKKYSVKRKIGSKLFFVNKFLGPKNFLSGKNVLG